MKVVLVTIQGEAKEQFAHDLYKTIGDSLSLVVVQSPKKQSLLSRVVSFVKNNRAHLFREIYFALFLRFSPSVLNALRFVTSSTVRDKNRSIPIPVRTVASVNGDDVFNEIRELAPDLLIVWGSTILEPRIVSCAKYAINLHFGLCPYYRGAIANHAAVLHEDFNHIGATIHYINGKADAGDIIATEVANTHLLPPEVFYDLNNRALTRLLEVAQTFTQGKIPEAHAQDISESVTLRLKQWSPSVRYLVGKRILTVSERGGYVSKHE